MDRLRKILVAVDVASDAAPLLVEVATAVATMQGSEILWLTVVPHSSVGQEVMDRVASSTEAELNRVVSPLASPNPVKTLTVTGAPFDRIVEEADRFGADLIVIGSGNKEPGERFQLGTTAGQVARYARCPVWIVKPGAPFPPGHILCPVDTSGHARNALELALVLASAFKAEVTVMTVVEDLRNIYPGRPLIMPHEQGSYAAEQEAAFDAFLQDFHFRDVKWTKFVRYGAPDREILDYVRDQGCRLIVMGSEGRTGLSRVLMGSVAEKVLREVPCSVVTVKTPRTVAT